MLSLRYLFQSHNIFLTHLTTDHKIKFKFPLNRNQSSWNVISLQRNLAISSYWAGAVVYLRIINAVGIQFPILFLYYIFKNFSNRLHYDGTKLYNIDCHSSIMEDKLWTIASCNIYRDMVLLRKVLSLCLLSFSCIEVSSNTPISDMSQTLQRF